MGRVALRTLAALIAVPLVAAASTTPSNEQVTKTVEEISRAEDYRWLRRQGDPATERAPASGRQGSSAKKGDGRASGKPDASGGCGAPLPGWTDGWFEDDLAEGDPEPEEEVTPIDFGSCNCSPTIGHCGGFAIGRGIGIVGYLLAGLALIVIIFIVVRAVLNREKRISDAPVKTLDNLSEPEQLRLSEIPVAPSDLLMAKAADAARMGDFKSAVGWTYLAGIGKLHRAGFVALDRSTTNIAILRSTRRKGGPEQEAAVLIDAFEELFFGEVAPTADHWERCRDVVTIDFAALREGEGTYEG